MTQPSVPKKRILSGVQPSGKLHLGNYLGAVRQHIAAQNEGECHYFIADYHALTTVHDPAALRAHVLDVALDYFSLGLDPEKTIFFRQSDIPEVCELSWILSTVAPMGLLEKAVSYKEKVEKGLDSSVGLFTYPVLMAADILAYRSHLVPVGRDQVQHLEITRDLAVKFNNRFGDTFPLPDYRLTPASKVPGTDGQKMSKSYGNTIDIFAEGKALKKAVMGVVTDSKTVEEAKDPSTCTVFALHALFATPEQGEELKERYQAGGMGYGAAKTELLALIDQHFAQAREKRRELAKDMGQISEWLRQGALKARAVAGATLDLVRSRCGLR
ncbi:MAG: tryptophan--tRNA ligase [Planctomycetota bacterium]|nr:MAG: tryptophan--tRNA ligase [Planctomycetota bacterium]